MILAGMLVQAGHEVGVAAIETFPIMRFRNRFFVPGWKVHTDRGEAAAAARNLSLGAGGFSRSSMTRA